MIAAATGVPPPGGLTTGIAVDGGERPARPP